MYKNHHQIYTHSPKHGVVIGQYWRVHTGNFGRVACITENGYVVLLPENKAWRFRLCIHIDDLVRKGELQYPSFLQPYKRVNGEVAIQVVATDVNRNKLDYWVCGELRREYKS